MRLIWATVSDIAQDDLDIQYVAIVLDEEDSNAQAICYPALSGRCAMGDRVLINTTAVDLGLGTGGDHLVVARGTTGVVLDDPSAGHIMKLRYTPLQRDVFTVEEQGSPHHDVMAEATDLTGMPVVCCGLHSQVVPVVAAIKEARPDARIAYVMTDGAALPLALSRVMRQASAAGLVDVTITSGQSFGGELEAVNLHSALLAARHVAKVDVAVVAIGPGVVGTATPFGHGGVAQGEAMNATAALGGVPIACLRVSFADSRSRHRGVSHHTLTALTRVALTSVVVAIPVGDPEQTAEIEHALADADVWERHCPERVEVEGLPHTRGIGLRSMGRGPDDDPAFFAAAVAAGRVAAVRIP
ncbi:MAG: DUF3866 family protein [Coriobacteriia bacterium]|nr:DUF3866 family protein [Coriobacteriia bacterium]